MKTDNASAFKSTELQNYWVKSNIGIQYSTPYVHTPLGLVERTKRTLEDYTKTMLIEENELKKAVKRAVKALTFSWSASTKKTPFELFFNRKPRTESTNVFDLENKGKDLLENVYDSQGNHLTQFHYTDKRLREMTKERKFGRTAGSEELQREIRKRKVSHERCFAVRNGNERSLDSKFETKPRPLISESEHTVFDGRKVLHKKDVAETTKTVTSNRDVCQAKEIAEKVHSRA